MTGYTVAAFDSETFTVSDQFPVVRLWSASVAGLFEAAASLRPV